MLMYRGCRIQDISDIRVHQIKWLSRVTLFDEVNDGIKYYLDSHSNVIYIINMLDKKLTSDLLRGHTDTIILKLLADGDKYGYEIAKLAYDLSGQEYELKEATMYSSLKRLESDGHIASYWGDETQGGRRKYYRITAGGKKQYEENKQNWQYAKKILEKLL